MNPFNFSRRKVKSTIVILVIVGLVFFYFIFTMGLKLLLNTSVFIANLSNKSSNSPSVTKNDNLYGSISIDNIPNATNSAQIVVSGSVLNYDQLEFFINGQSVKKITSVNSDNYSETIGDLSAGANEVFVRAKTSDGKNTKNTDVFSVVYKNKPPTLDISEPSDNTTTSSDTVSVKGTTDKEVFIKVNDLPEVVDATGHFEASVKLNDGDNTITIIAADDAGNSVTKSLKVTYHKDN